MKNMKFVLLGLALIGLFVFPVNALENEFSEEEIELNYKQTLLAGKIDDMLKDDNGSYPDYFGGIYISSDSKNVILQIVNDNIPNDNSNEYDIYKNIINMDDSIIIEYVNNSYNYLNDLKEMISELTIKNGKRIYKNFSSVSIDIVKNKIKVNLVSNNGQEQTDFIKMVENSSSSTYSLLNLSKLELIDFGEATYTATSINAGQRVPVPAGGCSVGFRTKYNGKIGFVTAGHCLIGNGGINGIVRLVNYSNGGSGDYGFVEANQYTGTLTNKIAFPSKNGPTVLNDINNQCPSLYRGTKVAMSGSATAKYVDGNIIELDTNACYVTGECIYGLMETNFGSKLGDSGGTVYLPLSDKNGGGVVVGVVSGGDVNNMYFTSINNMPIEFISGRY